MAKLTLSDLANLQNEQTAVSTLASNNTATETAVENTVSRDGTAPNQMEADFDMNSNRILNLPQAVAGTEPVRKREFDAILETLEGNGSLEIELGNSVHFPTRDDAEAAEIPITITRTYIDREDAADPPFDSSAIYLPGAGFHSFVDGNANTWHLDATSKVVDLAKYGVRGDVLTDQASAINTAITQAGANSVLLLPPGDILVNSSLLISDNRVWLVGRGIGVTTLIFEPTANDTLIEVGDGATLLVQGGLRDFSIYSADDTYTKIAISISDIDIYEVRDISINGGSGFTGGTGSIGIKTMGRDFNSFRNITINADRPLLISGNPNSTIDIDHYNFNNMYMICSDVTRPVVEIESGVNLSHVTFDGYQSWVQGKDGLRWVDTAATIASHDLFINNVRMEQGDDATGYAFNIQHNSTLQNLVIRGCRTGVDRNGFYLRKVFNGSIENCYSLFGVVLDIDTSSRDIEWKNCAWQTGTTISVGSLTRQWGSGTTTGPLPTSGRYSNISAANNESDIPIGGRLVTIANDAVETLFPNTVCGLAAVSTLSTTAAFYLRGPTNNASIAVASAGFSDTLDNASTLNVYYSGGNYVIQNKTGSEQNVRAGIIGRAF